MKLKRSWFIAVITLVPGLALAANSAGFSVVGCCPWCPL